MRHRYFVRTQYGVIKTKSLSYITIKLAKFINICAMVIVTKLI
ncbi:hypothetical protein ARSQ2_01219 [Arsenophonus endosymbiont of Bemisia tabaci Q2]|nr:hypothetical protein ARSQ2_01219 [Arsenophonus endosymbiont of Bemisia tabaci Q2]